MAAARRNAAPSGAATVEPMKIKIQSFVTHAYVFAGCRQEHAGAGALKIANNI